MKRASVALEFDDGKNTTIIRSTSCWHIGCGSWHKDGIDLFLARCREERTPWVHHGDLIEAIAPNDKRFDAGSHTETLLAQAEHAASLVAMSRLTCLGLLVGNHEWRPSHQMGNLAYLMSKTAGVPYLGGPAAIEVICPDGRFIWSVHHGSRSMNFQAGTPEDIRTLQRRKLRRLVKFLPGLLRGVGHFHRPIIAPPDSEGRLVDVPNEPDLKYRACAVTPYWAYACPSMYKNYSPEDPLHADRLPGYAEQALMPPTGMGWIDIVVNRNATVAAIRDVDECGVVQDEVAPIVAR